MSSPSFPAFPPTSARSDSETSERAITRAIATDSPRSLKLEGDEVEPGEYGCTTRSLTSTNFPTGASEFTSATPLSASSVRGVTS